MVEQQVTKHRRSGWRRWQGALVALVVAACGETASPDNGSETHFLLQCFESCGQGFECLGGVCTENCDSDAECSELSEGAVCADAGEGCRVFCDGDADCTQENADWVCDDGQCVSSRPPSDSPASPECPLFEGGVQEPVERGATQSAVPNSDDTGAVVADDTGVFWQEADNGAVGGFIGEESLQLHPPTLDVLVSPMGIITDATTVYFAEAGPPRMSPPEEPGLPPPPGLLWAVPKAGGDAELLLQLDDEVMTPLAVTDQGVVIRSGERLYVVKDDSAELLAHIPPTSESQLQVADGRAYWSDWSSVREPTELYVVDLAGGEPEVITEINGSFVVGHGRVLWKTETLVEDPLVMVEELFMLDLDTGCVTELPSRGESMGTLMLDARHVYWESYNALGNSPDPCNKTTPLTRVNLTTGSLEELSVEGFESTLCTDPMAQSDDKLYMRTSDGHSLVAIDKP